VAQRITKSLFANREDAGRQLAERLNHYRNMDALVLAIPRGGVEIGYYVAEHLNATLIPIITKKLPHPLHPEYAIGAVCEEGTVYMNRHVSISQDILTPIVTGITREINRRIGVYRKGEPLPPMAGKTVIIVDDGIATGATLASAVLLCRKHLAAKVVVAAPFSSKNLVPEITDADELVILHSPDFFAGVGQAYDDFTQLTDEDVLELLARADAIKTAQRPVPKIPQRESYPLQNSKDLDALMARIGDARIVLLGEASHGTHEYYTWRSAISRRLITEKGFNFIAVEGDWPDCYRVNRYIKGYADRDKTPRQVLAGFNRWPTWMWANWEMVALIDWLRINNRNTTKKTGFYGLDIYSLWESLETLVKYLEKTDPAAAQTAREALDCFSGHNRDEHSYARHALTESCKDELAVLLREIRYKASTYNMDPEAALNTIQNATTAADAEHYYRSMVAFNHHSWNIRDRHMMNTLNRLLDFHGPDSKAIVWEHNTHIGDARFTDMAKGGMFNIGQLARDKYTELNTVLVGFGSYHGSVIAGTSWGAPMQEMNVPEARPGSIEEVLHRESTASRYYLFNQPETKQKFNAVFPHRAIGVVYNPATERGNYVPSLMSSRYDAFCYIDKTSALRPLHITVDPHQVPETYPFEF
jgi:erythromycin esterase